jgi:hypothetical protein
MSCYLFTDIPGSGKGWTLAVFAISHHDAREYIKACHSGGRFVREVKSGEVKANCGATTDKERERLRAEMQRIEIL